MSNVNHPSHYNQPGKKETILQMVDKHGMLAVLIFCELNYFKYCDRAGFKNDGSTNAEQDMAKAEWYAQWLHNHANKFHKLILRVFFNIKL